LIKPANFDFDITRQKLEILTDDEVVENAVYDDSAERDPEKLTKAFNFAIISSVALTIILIIIWPLPMYGTRYVFSRPFFTFWVAISMIWAICSTIACTIYPVGLFILLKKSLLNNYYYIKYFSDFFFLGCRIPKKYYDCSYWNCKRY
jgi:hypothetical protein